MTEERAVYISQTLIDEALRHCRELVQTRERDFVTVPQQVASGLGLSLVDVRTILEDCYNTVRDEWEAMGEDLAGTTPATEVAEAARWLNRWLTSQTYLHSVARDYWNAKSRDAAS